MKNKLVGAVVVVVNVMLTACATSPQSTAQARPTKNILDSAAITPKDGAARLIVKRDPGFVGSACAIRVLIDGRPLAELAPGEVVTAFLTPSEYIVGAISTGVCGGGDAEASAVLRAGQLKTFRISIDEGMSIRIGPTAY